MFHPVGSQPPSVYWRRRVVFAGAVVVLIVLIALTVNAIGGGGGATSAGAESPSSSSPATHAPSTSTSSSSSSDTVVPPTSSAAHTSSPPSSKAAKTGSSGSAKSTAGNSAAPPPQCTAKQLDVQAITGQNSYQVGDKPLLELQVINTTSQPCVQDVADKQIVLSVYNGESRVWGSHDCEIQPGVTDRTLAPAVPVRVQIVWSGYSSQPNCAGTRQKVGAGTYTLYAALAGHTGKATQFSMT